MRARAALLPAALWLLACGGEDDAPRPSRAPAETRGGDEGLLDPVLDPASAPPTSRYAAVEVARGREAARARSWAGAARLREGTGARGEPGNFLCRLWALYGPPPGTPEGGFRYVVQDAELGYVLVAYADAGGPAFGAVITNEEGHRLGDEDRITRSVDDFARLVDATRPVDCALEVGGRTIGVRAGQLLP
jgi:hypothetical protein